MRAFGNQAEELVKVALFNGIKLLTIPTLDFNFALYQNTFEEQLVAIRATIFLKGDAHTTDVVLVHVYTSLRRT